MLELWGLFAFRLMREDETGGVDVMAEGVWFGTQNSAWMR